MPRLCKNLFVELKKNKPLQVALSFQAQQLKNLTTTATVLAQALISEGVKSVATGMNQWVLNVDQ